MATRKRNEVVGAARHKCETEEMFVELRQLHARLFDVFTQSEKRINADEEEQRHGEHSLQTDAIV